MKLIPLTEEHIAYGSPGICACCPVAMALKDAGYNASVHPYKSYLHGTGTVSMSEGLSHWIITFDNGISPDPFTIVLHGYALSTLTEYQDALRA